MLELSSFQLDGMYRFRADVAVLTNITPDHLDRYDYCFQNYADSKMRIVRNQHSRCAFIYSADDPVIAEQLPRHDLRMRELPFAARAAVASGAGDAFLCDGKFTATVGHTSVEIDTAQMKLAGLHNAYNAMAAALAALAAGVAPEQVRRSICAFDPVEHRLEPRRRVRGRGVDQRLEGHERRFGVVCAGEHDASGGVDRRRHGQGQRLRAAQEFARQKVRTLVCMGADNAKLVAEFTGVVPQIVSHRIARRGDAGGTRCGASGRCRAALARLRQLRPVQKLRTARRAVQAVGGRTPGIAYAEHGSYAGTLPLGGGRPVPLRTSRPVAPVRAIRPAAAPVAVRTPQSATLRKRGAPGRCFGDAGRRSGRRRRPGRRRSGSSRATACCGSSVAALAVISILVVYSSTAKMAYDAHTRCAARRTSCASRS